MLNVFDSLFVIDFGSGFSHFQCHATTQGKGNLLSIRHSRAYSKEMDEKFKHSYLQKII